MTNPIFEQVYFVNAKGEIYLIEMLKQLRNFKTEKSAMLASSRFMPESEHELYNRTKYAKDRIFSKIKESTPFDLGMKFNIQVEAEDYPYDPSLNFIPNVSLSEAIKFVSEHLKIDEAAATKKLIDIFGNSHIDLPEMVRIWNPTNEIE